MELSDEFQRNRTSLLKWIHDQNRWSSLEMSNLLKISKLFTVIPIHPENSSSKSPKPKGGLETPSAVSFPALLITPNIF